MDNICWYTFPNGDYCGLEAEHEPYEGTEDWPATTYLGNPLNPHRPPHPSEVS